MTLDSCLVPRTDEPVALILSVPKKLGTISRSNGTWNVGFRGEGKPQIPENNLSQQRLKNHPQNLNEDSITRVILIDLFG